MTVLSLADIQVQQKREASVRQSLRGDYCFWMSGGM
jgi:hypothetical protein